MKTYTITQTELYKWAKIESTIELEISQNEIDELINSGEFSTENEVITALADTQGTTVNQRVLTLEDYKSRSNIIIKNSQ